MSPRQALAAAFPGARVLAENDLYAQAQMPDRHVSVAIGQDTTVAVCWTCCPDGLGGYHLRFVGMAEGRTPEEALADLLDGPFAVLMARAA